MNDYSKSTAENYEPMPQMLEAIEKLGKQPKKTMEQYLEEATRNTANIARERGWNVQQVSMFLLTRYTHMLYYAAAQKKHEEVAA